MPRHYSPRDFLRQAPNALLARYFHERNLLTDLDIDSLAETDVQPIFEALAALAPELSARVDSDFALVTALADEQGIQAILDEAQYHQVDVNDAFDSKPGFLDRALWTFLEHPRIAEVARLLSEVDRFPTTSWIRRRDDVFGDQPRDDAAALAELSRTLGSYFRLKEGRGRECFVDVYRRGTKLYYFAFPEDYAHTSLEYLEGKLERRAHRTIFQVVFVCDPATGTLDTYFRGQKKTRLEIETIFSRVILGSELDPWKNDRVYNLNAFKGRGVTFVYDPMSGIHDIRVKHLRLTLIGGGSRRITLEADPSADKETVHDMLATLFASDSSRAQGGWSPALANITRIGLQVYFSSGSRRGRNTKTFYLTYPNGCTLGHDGRDATLRQMLIDSKIETIGPAPAGAKT